ncbi:MAG: alpha-L-rhamnosidase C-terminal domain-containing protein [Acidimicrobiales bacterium]
MAPRTADVIPLRVVRTSGSVTGAKSLTDPAADGSGATLTMRKNGTPPTIVVDYGKDVGGVPYFVVRSAPHPAILRSAYSEGLQYLGPNGDQTASASPAGDSSRVDDVTVASPGRVTTGSIQGGERYERISLTTPGTVTLSSIGIDFTAVRATASDYRGWFDSSSASLDRIWYDGAYTTQLDELPADAVPVPWRITDGSLDAVGGGVQLLGRGLSWTDYTMSFETRVVDDSTTWMVRATSASSGYLFILHEVAGAAPSQDTLQEIALGPNGSAAIDDVVLPGSVIAGAWQHISTVAVGSHITTSIDGRQVASITTGALSPGTPVYASGTVALGALGSSALFRDLDITGPGGKRLFADTLSKPSALADFPGPNATTADPFPAIMDGAKRDRVVWSGDLGVEVPDVLTTTGASAFVRASLRLLGSYQTADGESGTNINPTVPLGTFPQSGPPYSASYSMDEVDNIATYYLYTGDLSFVRSEWPVITRELAYNRSMVDGRGLLVTDDDDGQDWDYYDGSKDGAVSAYNDIYYETLRDAATMADALGLSTEAYVYSEQATSLRTAINAYLLDPSTGLYVLSDLQPDAVAQDANSLAVLFGVAPEHEDATILAELSKTLPSTPYGPESFTTNAGYRAAVSPFVTNEEVEALFASGDTAAATALVQKLWGYMDGPGPDDTGTDWELVGARGLPAFGDATSLSHGWSSGATADLSSYVLGVEPSTPGFRTWVVQPHPGSLSWVEGDVPSPHGTVDVRWAQDRASGRFTLEVTAPARTSGTISVPVPRGGAVITVRATEHGRSTSTHTVHRVASGTTYLPITATGNVTYDISVVPR